MAMKITWFAIVSEVKRSAWPLWSCGVKGGGNMDRKWKWWSMFPYLCTNAWHSCTYLRAPSASWHEQQAGREHNRRRWDTNKGESRWSADGSQFLKGVPQFLKMTSKRQNEAPRNLDVNWRRLLRPNKKTCMCHTWYSLFMWTGLFLNRVWLIYKV